MKNIAVICGGDSGEYEVSLDSAKMVIRSLDKDKFRPFQVIVKGNKWKLVQGRKKYDLNKTDFTCTIDGKKIKFACVYNIIHGTPGEDGKIQGYFDLLGVPYTSPNSGLSGLTMNKHLSKKICEAEGYKVAKGILVKSRDEVINVDQIARKVGIPCFVKPNNGGSSVATIKAYSKEEIVDGIEEGFQHDDEVIIEQFLKGKEVTCGVYYDGEKVQSLPVTEIIPHNDFFDYDAKYNGESDEITPAELDKKLYKKIQLYAAKIYDLFNLKGLIRVDFIVYRNEPYFMEINTIPGFSKASIIPQQIRAAGLKETDILTLVIEQALKRN